jgi:AcrR family transcriptional regulator
MRPTEPRQSFTGAARREQITRAAIDVLAEEGFAATSIAAIADRLGVSKGILSYHFPAKSELLTGVVGFVLEDAGRWMTARMGRSTSFRGALRTYISSNLSYLDGHRTEILALTEILANARAVPGVPELFARSQEDAVSALESLFDAGRAAGEFGDVPSRMLAIALRSTIDSTSANLRADPAFDLSPFESELTHLFDHATAPIESESREE